MRCVGRCGVVARVRTHFRAARGEKPFGNAFERAFRRRNGSRRAFLTPHARGTVWCRARGVSAMRCASCCGVAARVRTHS
eukprot:720182-Lingulodinium_polyedra.AAC.1